MPHKHKRKREDQEESNFDLPPSSRARTLSVHQKSETIFESSKDKKSKREAKKAAKKSGLKDDTPKSFARLMAFHQHGQRLPSGLDDGTTIKTGKKKTKKNGRDSSNTNVNDEEDDDDSNNNSNTNVNATEPLQILPGERLSEFAARVDQSLPLTSVPRHQTRINKIPGLEKIKTPLTKHNKRLARLQSEWRNAEAKRRAAQEEEDEELADRREEDDLLWLGAGVDKDRLRRSGLGGGGKKKNKDKKKHDPDDVDPWKQLERKRREEGELRQKNLQDVVLAPPVLKSVKNIFKDKGERSVRAEKIGTVSGVIMT
ncbi:hypothetical protein PV08_01751 [Exophiala spinifera]|uniref:Uncharacterized protein n=1 Tax=Exophiala spinifera TaxID=91928 RepID=A0A0D1Z0N6_9EURO|nr:uncharacterized protein PV08_01751 [Exophiala spinifera]KIW21171.1 hypothetical protein PV08_01751 [Exophiala spinifera]